MVEVTIIKKELKVEFPLTDNERYIIETLRSLRPFEFIKITADKTGKINNFLIERSYKTILSDNGPINVSV